MSTITKDAKFSLLKIVLHEFIIEFKFWCRNTAAIDILVLPYQ